MNEIVIECDRCHGDATGGVAMMLSGPATGFNKERGLLCPDCVQAFRWFMAPKHVDGSESVTALGLAHIATCLECNAKFGGGVPVVQKRERSERFASGGFAQ